MGTSPLNKKFPKGNKYPSGKKQSKRFERFLRKLSSKVFLSRRRHIYNPVGGQKKTGSEAPVSFQKGDIMKNEK